MLTSRGDNLCSHVGFVSSAHEYTTIWVNTDPTCLLNKSRFLNLNMTYLLNGLIVSTCLSDFIKMKKQTNKYLNIKSKTNE